MMINKIFTAAIGATQDRRLITRVAKGTADPLELQFAKTLEKVSGPSVHAPKAIVKSWYKAYVDNVKRLKRVEIINRPFERKSAISKIFHRLTNK